MLLEMSAAKDRRWRDAVAARPWKRNERRVVLRGFAGRLAIAVEPLLVAVFFTALPIGMFARKLETAVFLAPIFGLAAVAFMIYAVILIAPSARAVIETFGHIYIVDGYIRYREHQDDDMTALYYAAVLDANREVLGEWRLAKRPTALDQATEWPALVEFSRTGILRIDGHSTGVLPEEMPALGVGASNKLR